MDHDDSIDPVTRQSLRVLADSTKQASGNQRTAQRIAQAAESGRRADYLLAEASFNALSPDQRQVIGSKAKERAEEVAFELRNTERGDLHHRGDMAAGSGSGVDWGRTVRGRSKDPEGRNWDWRAIPDQQGVRRSKVNDQTWDWQSIPEDPVTRGAKGRKKPTQNSDEFEALRQQMLDAFRRPK